jgi:hypothetical protein
VEITGLVGIYTNPRHLIEYTSDGEVRQEFSIVRTAKPTGGEATTSDEASEVIWADPSEVGDMPMPRDLVSGQEDLPGGGHRRLPADGHFSTLRSVPGRPRAPRRCHLQALPGRCQHAAFGCMTAVSRCGCR